jgi:hypothetical protein
MGNELHRPQLIGMQRRNPLLRGQRLDAHLCRTGQVQANAGSSRYRVRSRRLLCVVGLDNKERMCYTCV